MIYIIKPTDGTEPYEVQADRAEYDKQTGASCFYRGSGDSETLVARVLNVSFAVKADAAE